MITNRGEGDGRDAARVKRGSGPWVKNGKSWLTNSAEEGAPFWNRVGKYGGEKRES